MKFLTKIFLTLIFTNSVMFSQTINDEATDSSAQSLTSEIESIVIDTITEESKDTSISSGIEPKVEEEMITENLPDSSEGSIEQESISESFSENINEIEGEKTIVDSSINEITEEIIEDAKNDTINSLNIVDCFPNCRKGFICVDGECLPSQKEISTSSIEEKVRLKYMNKLNDLDRLFISTNIIYSIGSWYSAITPMIYSQKSWDRYSYYDRGHYDKFEVITYAPGSSVYITFGSMNLVQIAKSVSLLKEVDAKPNTNLQTAGIVLYASAILSTTINITSIFADNKTFTATTSLVNAALVISAYAVNTATYAVNRNRVKNSKVLQSTDSNRGVDILPYVYSDGEISGAGLALKF